MRLYHVFHSFEFIFLNDLKIHFQNVLKFVLFHQKLSGYTLVNSEKADDKIYYSVFIVHDKVAHLFDFFFCQRLFYLRKLLAHKFASLPHELNFIGRGCNGLAFERSLREKVRLWWCVNVIRTLFNCGNWFFDKNLFEVWVLWNIALLQLHCFVVFQKQIV